ncbi:hypothetical protein AMATHDRAFT_5282 [Amanita thiersii Skay4041]|uniref:Uncharacterized protein n=1 Tax=Amanita thiersii Skay4041 TaxID=703135 RepID=A0A2A9NMS5_9AGAR|nr:hypothetical protein AMATHDRAFT_5282 [Amanita thiersii Skay4041]
MSTDEIFYLNSFTLSSHLTLSDNMGSGGSKISDVWYPDNPKRRARASQLKEDVDFLCHEFEELKKKRDELLNEIKPRVNELMKKYGYNTTDDLDQAVVNVLKGKALEEYTQIKAQMSAADEVATTIFQLVSIIGAATGVFLGALVALGIMTGGAAIAVIGVIAGILAFVSVAAVLFTVFQGAIERTNMRKAITDLSYERVKARAAYEAMNSLANWLYNIKLWLDDPLISENEGLMKKKLEGDFMTDYNKSKRSSVVKFLEQYDAERNAWTDEDPDWKAGEEDIISSISRAGMASVNSVEKMSVNGVEESELESVSDSVQVDLEKAPTVKFDYTSPDGSGSLQLLFLTSNETSCKGLDENTNSWMLQYESGHETKPGTPRISDYLFSLEDLETGKVYKNCQLTFLSRPAA